MTGLGLIAVVDLIRNSEEPGVLELLTEVDHLLFATRWMLVQLTSASGCAQDPGKLGDIPVPESGHFGRVLPWKPDLRDGRIRIFVWAPRYGLLPEF